MTANSSRARRLENSLRATDAMSPELRQCVHEYGYAIVNACFVAGVRRPSSIHALVREIWEGARQPRQTRNTGGTLDWLLLQAGAQISVAELNRVLGNNSLAIMPIEPTTLMVEASMAQVSGGGQLMTKREKHRRRLKAALAVGAQHLETPKRRREAAE
jgi:hypothetical protein